MIQYSSHESEESEATGGGGRSRVESTEELREGGGRSRVGSIEEHWKGGGRGRVGSMEEQREERGEEVSIPQKISTIK